MAAKYLAVGDINNDGFPDVVVDDYDNNTVYIALGNGDGTLQTAKTLNSVADGIAIGDFNRDGNPDLAIITDFSGVVTIFTGDGTGNFTKGSSFPTSGNGSDAIVAADFNHDGKMDLATANLFSSDVSVLLGNGDGTFSSAVAYPLETAVGPKALAVGDVTGDGILDIVASESGAFKVAVFPGNGNGGFGASQYYTVARHPFDIAISDLNGDGKMDVTVATNNPYFATVLPQLAGGTLGTPQDFAVACRAAAIAAGYLDNNNLPDLITAGTTGTAISILLSGPLPPPVPALGISKNHSLYFTQGQSGATFSIVVSNAPNSAATSGTVTVTDSLPTGLTACVRTSSLAAG